jgi:hypothetical protein
MSGIRQAFERLRAVRHIEWVMLCIACAAVLILMGGEGRQHGSTQLELRMENVLGCMEGAGEVRVLVNEGAGGAVVGVVVVAQGARDLRVAMALQQAVQALMDIDAAQIEVLSMQEDIAAK